MVTKLINFMPCNFFSRSYTGHDLFTARKIDQILWHAIANLAISLLFEIIINKKND